VTQRAQVSQSQNERFPQATALKLPSGASLLNSGAKTKISFRLPPNQIEQRRSAWHQVKTATTEATLYQLRGRSQHLEHSLFAG
jgi:hypothetical protein